MFTTRSTRRGAWLTRMLGVSTQQRRRTRRAPLRLHLEAVEDRLAPAVVGVLSISGTTLTYSGFVQNTNNVTISGTAAALTFADAGGTIQNNTGGQFANGGALPGFITAVAVNTNDLTDVANISGAGLDLGTRAFTLSSNFINVAGNVSARAVTFNATQTNVSAMSTIATNAAVNPAAGPVTFTTNLNLGAALTVNTDSVTDGNVTFNRLVTGSANLSINAGTGGNVTFNNLVSLGGTANLAIQNGAAAGVNNLVLRQTVLGGTLTARAANAVTFVGAVAATGDVLIQANQDGVGSEGFTQSAGDLSTASAAATAVNIRVNRATGGTGNANLRNVITGPAGTVTIDTTGLGATGGGICDGNGPGLANITTNGGAFVGSAAGPLGVKLDTSVCIITITVVGTPPHQVKIENEFYTTLEVKSAITAGGNVCISNKNGGILVSGPIVAGGASTNVILIATGVGSDITIGAAGSVTAAGDKVTLNAGGLINDSAAATAITAGTVALTAGTGIGTTSTLNIDADSLSAATTSGGIDVSDSDDLIVTGATASAGNISLTTATVANADLTISGNVATSNGDIVLTFGEDLFLNRGVMQASGVGVGNVTLTPTVLAAANTHIIAQSAGSSIVASGNFAVTGTTENGQVNLSGSTTAGGTASIETAASGANLLVAIDGSLTAGGAVSIGGTGVTATSIVAIGGTVATGAGLAIQGGNMASTVIQASGTSVVTTNGATTLSGGTSGNTVVSLHCMFVNAGGPTTITGSTTTGASTISMSGCINSSGPLSVTYAGSGTANIVMSGQIASGAAISVGNAAATGALYATLSGSLTGASFTINGSTVADTINVSGTLTGNATINGNAGDDVFYLKPQAGSAFTIDGGAGAADTVQILTSVLNIVAANLTTATFTVPSGFQSWSLANVETIIPFV